MIPSNSGHSKFDTTHEGQHQHQQYRSIDNIDEGNSQPRGMLYIY
jgi:hypothetical protein